MTHRSYIKVMTEREKKIVHITRRLAFEEAIQLVLSVTEPGERAPASYFVRLLELRK